MLVLFTESKKVEQLYFVLNRVTTCSSWITSLCSQSSSGSVVVHVLCFFINLYKKLLSSPVIDSYLPAQSVWFLQLVSPTGFSTFETLGNISGSNLTVFGLDHRGAFQVLIFPSLCVGVVYCREPYFSLYSVDPVISPAVNHCLHPGRPGDALRISSFSFLAAASGSQSLSNLLLLHPDRVPLKLLFF